MADVSLEKSQERIEAAGNAASEFVADMEGIRDGLDADDQEGTTLGKMVESQVAIIDAEAGYQVKVGIPSKVAKTVKAAAGELKQGMG